MIKPYNNPKYKITKENSMFNNLPKEYSKMPEYEKRYWYNHELIMGYEMPIVNNMTEVLKALNYETKQIKNEQYYSRSIENHIRLKNIEYDKRK